MNRNYVALDLETTGLSPEFDEIIEVGVVKFQDEQVIDTFQSIVNPQRALHYRIKGRQSSIYVPDDLAEEVQQAVRNARALQELMVVVGTRYVHAIKAKRRG